MEARSSTPRPWLEPRGLVCAAICAAIAVLAARLCGVWGCVVVIVGVGFALRRGWTLAICALPAVFGAVEAPPGVAAVPAAGLVHVDAEVTRVVRRDLHECECVVALEQRGHASYGVVRGTAELLPGDRLRGVANLAPPDREETPRPPFLTTRIGAVEAHPGPTSLARTTTLLRNELEDRLLDAFAGDPNRALLCHLTIARGPPIDEPLVQAHRATGLVHLLAVSGAHASMLAWMLGLGFRLALGRDPWSARGYRLFCMGFLTVYGTITAWEPPMFRALIAFGLLMTASATGRRASVTAALALPALLTAWLMPADLGSVSFCLSYAAVAGLGVSGVFDRGAYFGIRSALSASFWAALMTAPLTLVYFGQCAPWTILATPILSPLVAFMLGGSLLVAMFGDAAAWLIAPCVTWVTDWYVAAVRVFGELPGAPVFATSRPPAGVLYATLLLTAVAVWRWPTRRVLCSACVALCAPHFATFESPTPGVEFCAVGHGSAVLLTTNDGERILVDCGAMGGGRRPARAVSDALRTARGIDALVISHADRDHYAGVEYLLRDHSIARAYLPSGMLGSATARALRRGRTPIEWIASDEPTNIGRHVELFAPELIDASTNDRSAWVRAELGDVRVILPGDAGERGIDAWLASAHAAPADVLALPHHGRGDERATRRLLDFVRPALCLVSNREHEPPPNSCITARRLGYTVFSTGVRGTIRIDARSRRVVCERPWTLP